MEPEHWVQVKEILNRWLDLEPDKRAAYLNEVCAGNPPLRAEIDSLLASHAQLGDFLAVSILEEYPREELAPGTRVGSYEIRDAIAEGGMGTVYRAVRTTDFSKQVALKVVKRGMDTDFILQRFRYERQILASLDHPNIARLLDGGATPDGRPYLVMEFVEGRPITEHAEHHALKSPERLQLFRKICSAVQFAHRNLVVHRDLKPSNILVTADGVPKLLDFGIAKLLEPDADTTVTSIRMMTPECASPEQVRGEAITTASDIYSLGVLLYELLTGERPYRLQNSSAEEIRRIVCETEPKQPSLVRPLPKELDNIVLKAMHKDPAQRYASAEQLSEDIERHLTGLPVLARTNTLGYRASKFIRRHRTAVVAAGVVILSLIAGMGATLWEAHIARLERARAERRFNDVRQLANSLMLDIHDAIRDLPGSLAARKLLVDRALQYLDSLAKESNGDPALQRELAVAYERVGQVQGGTSTGSLGDGAHALASHRKAQAIRQALVSSPVATTEDRLALARSMDIIGRLLRTRGELTEALALTRQSVVMIEALRAAEPTNPAVLNELQSAYDALGDVLSSNGVGASLGREQEATEIHRKAAELALTQVKLHPDSAFLKRRLAVALVKVSDDLKKDGRRPEALSYALQCRDIFAQLAASNPTNATFHRLLAGCYSVMGDIQLWDGDVKGSFESYSQAFATVSPLARADPKSLQARFDMISCYQGLGFAAVRLGRLNEARRNLELAIQASQMAVATDPQSVDAKDLLAYSEDGLADMHERNGEHALALASYRQALSLWEQLAAASPNDVDTRLKVASAEDRIGVILTRMGRTAEAMQVYRRALAGAGDLANSNPPHQWALYVVADAASGLGDVSAKLAQGADSRHSLEKWGEARGWYQHSYEAWQRVHNPAMLSPGTFECGSPARASAALVKCDTELGKLRAALQTTRNH